VPLGLIVHVAHVSQHVWQELLGLSRQWAAPGHGTGLMTLQTLGLTVTSTALRSTRQSGRYRIDVEAGDGLAFGASVERESTAETLIGGFYRDEARVWQASNNCRAAV
jgi:hypothetical protein